MLLQARSVVREARPIINPNSGFVTQLKQFEVQLKDFEAQGSIQGPESMACMPIWDFEVWRQSSIRPKVEENDQNDQAQLS